MANPNTAHEPSMEEILASIRQIISEDGDSSPASRFGSKASGAGRDDAFADEPDETEAEDAPIDEESPHSDAGNSPLKNHASSKAVSTPRSPADRTVRPEQPNSDTPGRPAPAGSPPPSAAAGPTFQSWPPADSGNPPADAARRPAPAAIPSKPHAASPLKPAAAPIERSLLSERSDAAVAGAFSALTHTILAQNARTLEDLVTEMLRPMLKDWLDDNLPSLVERLVREEIERVSRGRR